MKDTGQKNIEDYRVVFQEAVNFFISKMRIRTFPAAHRDLASKYGFQMRDDVMCWCYKYNITYHDHGRLFLREKYRQSNSTVKVAMI